MKNFDQLSKSEKYDLIKMCWKNMQKLHGNNSNKEYDFLEEPGKVNLFAARGFKEGQPVQSNNKEFDDTIFVVFQNNGIKYVEEFAASTEYGVVGSRAGGAILIPGQHKYRLAFHMVSLPHKSIKTGGRPRKGNQYKYRAFKPDTHVQIYRDKNNDLIGDRSKTYKNDSINIHFANATQDSAGCQILSGWRNYKRFIKLVEADHSIKGTNKNELAPRPAKNGKRPVIYTLTTGDDLIAHLNKMF